MVRSITESDVHIAADELVASSERPTVERIRRHLAPAPRTRSPGVVAIENGAIESIEGHAHVSMVDGRLLRFAGLFTSSGTVPTGSITEALG